MSAPDYPVQRDCCHFMVFPLN
uniref:Uncharacterized protein n=1 Tax=Anguilla anguilla TaxID=7936 RepID=A0A0E9VVT8_ANGAN